MVCGLDFDGRLWKPGQILPCHAVGGVCFWFIFLEILSQIKENEVVIFSDRSTLGNPGPTGAGAAVYLYQSSPILQKRCYRTLSKKRSVELRKTTHLPKTTWKIIFIGELYPPSICFLVVYI